jgi:hypothetical protein
MSLEIKFFTSAFILTPAPCKHWWIYEGVELQKLKREEKYNKLIFLACNYISHFNRSFARNIPEYVCHSLLAIIINIAVFASVSLQ